MKWSSLLFIVLALVLSAGTSYLALSEKFTKEDEIASSKMAVALVNEDQGTMFEGQKIAFGEQFIKGVGKDDKHQWHVVSRGVAENGLQNNNYNLMIVIPSDFSTKAVSIYSEHPEQLVLNYKINASGNEDLKLEAEKTASAILQDFNRRVIDVYFASIIGQLHTAQNNIGTIVKKEQDHMNMYRQDIHSPLANYTNQFQSVQSYTDGLVSGFGGFQGVLQTFGKTIDESSKLNSAFSNNFSGFQKTQETNDLLTDSFTNNFQTFAGSMNTDEVLKQLAVLESANKVIANQFDAESEQPNLLSYSAAVQKYLADVNGKIRAYDEDLTEELDADIQAALHEKLKKFISNDNEKQVYINTFIEQPNEQIKAHIQNIIPKLPSLDLEEIDQLEVPHETKVQLKNVAQVTKKYSEENGFEYERNDVPLDNTVANIKESLATDGITFTAKETIPKMSAEQKFYLHLPDGFELDSSSESFTINGKDYMKEISDKGYVTLPPHDGMDLDISARVKLIDVNTNIDVFAPITWKWTLDHKDEKVSTTTTPEVPEKPEVPKEEGEKEPKPTTPVPGENNGEGVATGGNQDETPAEPGKGENEKEPEGEGEKPKPDVPTHTEKTIERTNDKFIYEKEEHLYSESLNGALGDSIKIIQDYVQLVSLYNLYYGLDMQSEDLASQLETATLAELATPDSLYYMLMKQDVVDFLAKVVSDEIQSEVKADKQALKDKVADYKLLVDEADKNSAFLAQVLQETTEQAKSMNESLGMYLKTLASWRESSLKLVEEQQNVVSKGKEEQAAVVQLNSEVSSLFTQTQSLAEQSANSVSSSESVYDTFEQIDNEAKEIENSGKTIVTKADTLLTSFTKKVNDDTNFSKNFTKVLANSRTGDRPNEDLYEFLANPVQKQNNGIITAGDSFTPYLIVLVCFIVSLFTSYVIANYERQRKQTDDFEEEYSLVWANFPITAVAFGISLAEGVIVGLVSARLLQLGNSQTLVWVLFITTIMAAFIFVSTYLLRQAKMVGMFILLLFLSMYLFLTDAVGNKVNKISSVGKWQDFSPLQYVEEFLNDFMSGKDAGHTIFISILAAAIIGFILNLFVWRKEKKEVEVDEQTMGIGS